MVDSKSSDLRDLTSDTNTFCNFYLVKNHNISNNSTFTKLEKK